MTQDKSNKDGGGTPKRPEHWAWWARTLVHLPLDFFTWRCLCMRHTYTRPYMLPGARRQGWGEAAALTTLLSPFRVELIRCLIPHLKHSMGSGKATMHFALCSVSKSWCEMNTDQLQKFTHLLNMNETTKPDISSFPAKYTMPEVKSHKKKC